LALLFIKSVIFIIRAQQLFYSQQPTLLNQQHFAFKFHSKLQKLYFEKLQTVPFQKLKKRVQNEF